MALVDYKVIGSTPGGFAYLMNQKPDGLNNLYCQTKEQINWIQDTLGVDYDTDGFLLTDEQLSMFILKFS